MNIKELRELKISEMDNNMYQKYKNWCASQEFSDYAKFCARYRSCDFYVSGKPVPRCVAFANYAIEFHKAYMTAPDRLVTSYNKFTKKDNTIDTYRYLEFIIVKRSY